VTLPGEAFDPASQLSNLEHEFVPSRFHPQRVVVKHEALKLESVGPDPGEEPEEIKHRNSMPKELPRFGGGIELPIPGSIRIANCVFPLLGKAEKWIVGSNPVSRRVNPTAVPDLALRFAGAGLSVERMLGFVRTYGMPQIDCAKPPIEHGIRIAQFRSSSARLRFLIALIDAIECDKKRFILHHRNLIAELAVYYQRRLVQIDPRAVLSHSGISIDESDLRLRQRQALKDSGFDEYLLNLQQACEADPCEGAILLLNLQFNYYAGSPHRTIGYDREKGIISSTYSAGFLEFAYWQLYERYARNKKIKLCVECWNPFEASRRDAKRCKACRSSGAARKWAQRRRDGSPESRGS